MVFAVIRPQPVPDFEPGDHVLAGAVHVLLVWFCAPLVRTVLTASCLHLLLDSAQDRADHVFQFFARDGHSEPPIMQTITPRSA